MELKENIIYTITIAIITACCVLSLKALLAHQYTNIFIYMLIIFLTELFTILKFVKFPNVDTESISDNANFYYVVAIAVVTGVIFILLEVSKNIILSVIFIIAVIAGIIYALLHLDTIVNITDGIRSKTSKNVENFEEEEFNSAESKPIEIDELMNNQPGLAGAFESEQEVQPKRDENPFQGRSREFNNFQQRSNRKDVFSEMDDEEPLM